MKNVRELKSQLRAKYKKIRKSCPPEKKQQLDLALQNAFLASEEYKSCDVLFAFVSSPIEVDTSLILETTLKDGKRLALPKCKNNFGEMDFYLVNSLSQLEKGAFSIMEPNPVVCEKYEDFSHGLCLVPGLWIRQGLLRQIFTEFFGNKRWALLLQMYRAYSALGSVRPPR